MAALFLHFPQIITSRRLFFLSHVSLLTEGRERPLLPHHAQVPARPQDHPVPGEEEGRPRVQAGHRGEGQVGRGGARKVRGKWEMWFTQ